MAVNRDRAADPTGMLTASDEAAARDAGVPLLNVDRGGETTRALARSISNQNPEARSVIERAANDRFAGQGSRAASFLTRLTGGGVDDVGYQRAIRDAARVANRPAYEAAESAPGAQAMWNREFEQLMQAPAMQAAARMATSRGANRAAVEGFTPIRNPFAFGPDGRISLATRKDGSRAMPNLQFWDQAKRNLDGMIGRAKASGDRTMVSDLEALRRRLIDLTDSAVPEYRIARQGASAWFGAEDAIEAGRKFANSPRAIPETRRAMQAFSPAERDGFAIGYASELVDRIKAAGDRQNVIRQIFGSQASRESMEMAFGSQKARQIEAYVRVEELADRLRGAMGNSTTARQLVELGIGAGGGYALTGGDWKGALAGAASARGARWAGRTVNDPVMQNIAKLLTSNDPAAIQRAVANASMSPAYMRKLDEMSSILAAPARGAAMQMAQ